MSETHVVTVALRTGEWTERVWPFRVDGSEVSWREEPIALSRPGLGPRLVAELAGPIVDASGMLDPGDALLGDDDGPYLDHDSGRRTLDIGCTRLLSTQLAGRGEAHRLVGSREEARRLEALGLPAWLTEVRPEPGPPETSKTSETAQAAQAANAADATD